jgi:hypothetical protein
MESILTSGVRVHMAEILMLRATVVFTTGCATTDWEAITGLMSRLLGRILVEVAVLSTWI